MWKKFYLILILLLLVISIKAETFDFGKNPTAESITKEFNKTNLEYGKVTFYENLTKTKEITLMQNSKSCSNCEALFENITLYKPNYLVNKVRFETINDDGSRIEEPIISYQFYIQNGTEERIREEFKFECKDVGFFPNGTIMTQCNKTKAKEIKYQVPIWQNYTEGQIMAIGNYILKLEGIKRMDKTVDWIIDEIKDWAIWGGTAGWGTPVSFMPYALDSSSTTATTYCQEMTVNASYNVSLINASVNALDTSNNLTIYNYDTMVFVASKDITSNKASWNAGELNLTGSLRYLFCADSKGASRTAIRKDPASQPVNNLYLTWEFSKVVSGAPDTSLTRPIESVAVAPLLKAGSTLTLNSPQDNTFTNSPLNFFNASANIVSATLNNMSLWINSTGTFALNQTNVLTGAINSTQFNLTLLDGNYLWNILGCDSDNSCAFTNNNRTLTIDTIIPVINVIQPASGSFLNTRSVFINYTTTDVNDVELINDWNRSLVLDMRLSNGIGENATYFKDFSTYSNNGTCASATCPTFTTSGKFNGAYTFNGSQFVTIPTQPYFNALPLTLSVWVKTTNVDATARSILNKYVPASGNGWSINFYQGRACAWYFSNGGGYLSSGTCGVDIGNVSDGNWHNIVIIYNFTGLYPYRDGVLQTPLTTWQTGSPANSTTNQNISIGFYPNQGGFIGTIDEPKIFNRDLRTSEIKSLYDAKTNNYNANFTTNSDGVWYWTPTAIDQAGNLAILGQQNVTIDSLNPSINFTSPTPANNSFQNINSIYVNISSNDINNFYTSLDFNRNQILTMSFQNDNTPLYKDSSSYSINGTCIGTNCPTAITNGKFGNAMNFFNARGINFNVSLNNFNNNKTSVCAWVKPNNVTQNSFQTIFFKGSADAIANRDFSMDIADASQGNKVRWLTYKGGTFYLTTSNTILTDSGTWNHICGTFNSTTVLLYINGVLQTSTAVVTGGGMNKNTNNFSIGDELGSITPFNGSMDEIKIYNTALSQAEINSLYTTAQYSNNFTSLSDGKYNFTGYTVDQAGNTNQTEQRQVTVDTISPNITFISQLPSDISNLNVVNGKLNITYNITDLLSPLNISTIQLYHKQNSTTRDTITFINGTSISGYQSVNYDSNISATFLWSLDDNNIYPATYNFDPEIMENTPHNVSSSLTGANVLKTQFLNVTNSTQFNFLEIMANSTSGASPVAFYYCNSTYTTGTITSNSNCFNFNSLSATKTFNHTHTAFASHQIIPLVINTTSGKVGTVIVTQNSYLAMVGQVNWNYYFIQNGSRAGATETSTAFGIFYTPQSWTADMHLHQFSGNSSIYYYACANDTTGNGNCSSIRQDLFDLGGLPPTAPQVYSPTSNFYGGNITINYTSSLSPNGYNISFYNISLLNLSFTFNKTIITNNSNNLSYVWNSIGTPDGSYIIGVTAMDSLNQTSTGFSANFTIDNTYPLIDFTSPTPDNAITQLDNFQIPINVTTSELNFNNITYNLYDSINNTLNSTTFTALTTNLNFTVSTYGTYFYNVIITDLANNINQTETRTISISPTPIAGTTSGAGSVAFVCPNGTIWDNRTLSCIEMPINISSFEFNATQITSSFFDNIFSEKHPSIFATKYPNVTYHVGFFILIVTLFLMIILKYPIKGLLKLAGTTGKDLKLLTAFILIIAGTGIFIFLGVIL